MIPRPLSPVPAVMTVLAAIVVAATVWSVIARDRESLVAAPVVSPAPPDTTSAYRLAAGVGGAPQLAAIAPWSAVSDTATPTSSPTPTLSLTPTSLPTSTPPATSTPIPTLEPPQSVPVNGVPWERLIVVPPEVAARAREIFAAGRALGRDPRAFSKVGDSTTENPHFLARFDEGPYNLGAYAYLQPVIDQYRGSFGRDSLAVSIGLHAWTANDPMWAEASFCLPNETPVECEIRAHNPSVLIIRLGSNDVGVGAMFDANIRRIVDTAIAAGVVPVIGTKGDRHEGSNENNDILRRIAADYRIPLWDYDHVADTLPGRGLDVDGTHMLTFYAHDYTDPAAFTRGHAMHNLTALMALDAVWRMASGER